MAHVDLACELFKEVAAGSRPANSLVCHGLTQFRACVCD